MPNIVFISTIHKKCGNCNSNELYRILEKIKPEVIFLEALKNTYSNYDKMVFFDSGIYHWKLEIEAVQKFSERFPVKYVPVLENELPDSFDKKYKQISKNNEMQKLLDNFNSLASEHGFNFLNSKESINYQTHMRLLESDFSINPELEINFNSDIDEYENSMMRNINSYCKNNQFDSAVFMCGVAHRKSIIEKIEKFNKKEGVNLNWTIYGN